MAVRPSRHLLRARWQPEEQMYGIDVGFRDPSGNNVRLSLLNADFG